MSEYIEHEAVNCLLDKFIGYIDEDTIYRIKQKLNVIPSADVQEVRHGRWLENVYGCYCCSVCRDSPEYPTRYCSRCGAKMDKE